MILKKERKVDLDPIVWCSFSTWGQIFYELGIVKEFVVVRLSREFLTYLLEDGVNLPKAVDNEYGDSSIEEFPCLKNISGAVRKLGKCFVKMNWSAPKDASWVLSDNSLRCESTKDVLMLLKSSNFIAFDVERKSLCERILVLKKWHYCEKSLEFRCFVQQGKLVGVCQRNVENCYPFLSKLGKRKELFQRVEKYWRVNIMDNCPLVNYVFDVSFERDDSKSKIWLIDFNVFGPPTHPLLFQEWKFSKGDIGCVRVNDGHGPTGSMDRYQKPTPSGGVPLEFMSCNKENFQEIQGEIEKLKKKLDEE